VSCAKTAEPIEVPFGIWSQVGPRKHALRGVYIGATWRIPLNRLSAGVSVCLSVCHLQNDSTDRDAVWDAESS